jgi:hypothetical protein
VVESNSDNTVKETTIVKRGKEVKAQLSRVMEFLKVHDTVSPQLGSFNKYKLYTPTSRIISQGELVRCQLHIVRSKPLSCLLLPSDWGVDQISEVVSDALLLLSGGDKKVKQEEVIL